MTIEKYRDQLPRLVPKVITMSFLSSRFVLLTRLVLFFLLALLLVLFGTAVAAGVDKAAARRSIAVAVAGPWQPELEAYGRVVALRDLTIQAPFPAHVKRVLAETGQRVKKGEVLAALDAPALLRLLARVGAARRQLVLARKGLEALIRRRNQALATTDQVLQGKAGLNRAEAEVRAAWAALDGAVIGFSGGLSGDLGRGYGKTVDHRQVIKGLEAGRLKALARRLGLVRAPFDAFVSARRVSSGETVSSGAPLFVLEDISRVYIDVGIAEKDLDRLPRARAFVDTGVGEISMRATDSMALLDPATGLRIRRYLADNPNFVLQDGAWVRVILRGPEREVAWVPEAAVVARGGKTYCVVAEGKVFRAVKVTVGRTVDQHVPVTKGIEPGWKVVVDGAYEFLYQDLNRLMRFEE